MEQSGMATENRDESTGIDGVVENDDGNSVNDDGHPAIDSAAIDPVAAVKRGRGRPRKNRDGGSDGETGREKTREKIGAKNTQLDIGTLGKQITGVHAMAAILLKQPLIAISEREGEQLAQALKNLSKHYNVPISPVFIAWAQFAGVSAAIYIPKVLTIKAASKEHKDNQQQNTSNGIDLNFQTPTGKYRFQ